ncbi:MAG: glycosyltransferase family A protein, partial [Nanoarchaeota archaeon]
MKNPKISIIICTYNNKNLVKRCLDSIFSQNYKNFEVICVDGGSNDGTLELLKQYKVKIVYNKKQFPEGPGMGKSQGVKKAKGEIIAFIDQDNKLINHNCLKELVFPLIHNKEIFGVACKLYINKNDNITNRYLSYVGTDPFAVYRSLEGRMALNKVKLKDEGRYCTYKINLENCLCTGGNVFLVRRNLLNKIGGFVQDVEMIYSL